MDGFPAPDEGLLVALFLTVRDVERSRRFYSEVLGGEVVLAENPCTVKLANSWIIMNPGGGPTPDKPDVTLAPPDDPRTTSAFMNLRVADIDACYAEWTAKGAEFLTPPIDREAEIRCYLRDPDGYLIEVGQATGMLRGSSPAPAGPPGDVSAGLRGAGVCAGGEVVVGTRVFRSPGGRRPLPARPHACRPPFAARRRWRVTPS